jgi:hypothetical protein
LEIERLLELLLSNQAFFEQNFAEPDGHPCTPNRTATIANLSKSERWGLTEIVSPF